MRSPLRAALRPLVLLAGLVLAGLALRLLPAEAQHRLLDRWVVGRGVGGAALFVLAGAVLCAAGLPRQVAAFASGYAFGPWGGTALALLASLGGCGLDFLWARLVARRWVRARLRGRWARLDGFLAAHPFSATLTLRLLPVGSNVLLNLLAGASGVRAAPFLLASAIGYLPQAVVFVLLGGGTRVGRGVQLVLGAGLFVVASAGGAVLLRRRRAAEGSAVRTSRQEAPPPGPPPGP